MTRQLTFAGWLKLAAGITFAAVAYGGSYATIAEPTQFAFLRCALVLPPSPSSVTVHPIYDLPGPKWGAESFFAPAHWVDQKLRPEIWNP